MGEEEQKYLWMSRWWRLKFEADMAVEPDGDRFDTSIDPASINAVSGQFLMIRESANTEMFVALLLCVIFVLFLCQIKCKTAQKNAINFHSVPNAFSALFLLYLNICAARSCFYVSLHLCQITCPPT